MGQTGSAGNKRSCFGPGISGYGYDFEFFNTTKSGDQRTGSEMGAGVIHHGKSKDFQKENVKIVEFGPHHEQH